MTFALSDEDHASAATNGATWADPAGGTDLSASALKSDDPGQRFTTATAALADCQGVLDLGDARVGGAVIDVLNPSADTLARVVAGTPAVHRLINLDGVADKITLAGIDTSAALTFELWGRLDPAGLVGTTDSFETLAWFGTTYNTSLADWILRTKNGTLEAWVGRYDGVGGLGLSDLTSSLQVSTTGRLFYAALTISGTTATLYGMTAGGTLAQLDQQTVTAHNSQLSETLTIGAGSTVFTALHFAGARLWHGVAHTLADLTLIAGRPANYGKGGAVDELICEYLLPVGDWQSTTTITDSSYQSNNGTLTSIVTGDWATTPADLAPVVDSTWVNVCGPWSSRPVVEFGGTTYGTTAATADTTPAVSGAAIVWIPPYSTQDESHIVWFGPTSPGLGNYDWSVRHDRASGEIGLYVNRMHVSTTKTASVAVSPGPVYIYWEIDPWEATALLEVNGTEATATALPDFTANAVSKLFLGGFSSTLRLWNGALGRFFVSSAQVGSATAKKWLAQGIPYDARPDIRFAFDVDEATGATLTDRGAEGLNITLTNSSWARREYPAAALGTATGGGRQHERIGRVPTLAAADGRASELAFWVHDPQHPDAAITIGRVRALRMERFDEGRSGDAGGAAITPGDRGDERTPEWFSVRGRRGARQIAADVYCSPDERNTLAALVERGTPQLVSLGTSGAGDRQWRSRYGIISVAELPAFYTAHKGWGANARITIREVPV